MSDTKYDHSYNRIPSYEYENALAALAMLRDADKSKKLNKALIVAMKEIRAAAKKSSQERYDCSPVYGQCAIRGCHYDTTSRPISGWVMIWLSGSLTIKDCRCCPRL